MSLKALAIGVDGRVAEDLGDEQSRGTLVEVLNVLLPILANLKCNRKPPPPAPVDPTPNPSEARKAAYQTIWEKKCLARDAYDPDTADYEAGALRRAAREARHLQKKNGDPITHKESIALGRASLDAARERPLSQLVDAYLESQQPS